MTANPSVIGISCLDTLIPHITRVDFAGNIGNTFFRSRGKAISEYLGCSNSIKMGRCELKIVIGSSVSNLLIIY